MEELGTLLNNMCSFNATLQSSADT